MYKDPCRVYEGPYECLVCVHEGSLSMYEAPLEAYEDPLGYLRVYLIEVS